MYHSFLIHSSAGGHLGCFHVLAIKSCIFSKLPAGADAVSLEPGLASHCSALEELTVKGLTARLLILLAAVLPCPQAGELSEEPQRLKGLLPGRGFLFTPAPLDSVSGSNTYQEHRETLECSAKSLHSINWLLFSYYLSLESFSFSTHDFQMDCQPSHLTDVLNFSFLFRIFLNSYILDFWDHFKWSTIVRFQMPYSHLYLSLH